LFPTRRPALFAGVIAASLLSVSAIGATAQSSDPMADIAMVRVLHASPDAPNVDVYADGEEVLSDVAFGQISDYLEAPAGEYQIQVFAASPDPATDGAVIDAMLTFAAGTMTTVAATNNLATIEAQVIADAWEPVADQAQIRVVHFSADAPAVDIAPDGAEPIVADLAYPTATDYLTVPAGDYDLEVRPAGTMDVAVQLDPFTLNAGHSYSVFAIGSLAGGTLIALPVVDAVYVRTVTPDTSPDVDAAGDVTAQGAVDLALAASPGGAVVNLEVGREGLRKVWQVLVRTAEGNGTELSFDYGSGELVNQESETLPLLARTAPIVTAAEAIDNAEAAAGGGNVVELQLERELDRTIWEADVAGTSRRGVEVWVDAETGGLLGPASSTAVSCNRFGCKTDIDAQIGNTSVNCNRFGCNARR